MDGLREQFDEMLRASGLLSAMRFLNDRVPYRYSAIFRFDGDVLHNICLVDKQDPKTSGCEDQPVTQSYCMYIRNLGLRFKVEEAALDKRVEGHSKRLSVQSYYGIPLFDADGKMLGTVCHFDPAPVRVTDNVAAELDDLSQRISKAAFSANAPDF